MLDDLLPILSPTSQAFVRSAYGVLMLALLALTAPVARWFLVSERWRGYARSLPEVDWIQNPRMLPLVLTLWALSAGALVVGHRPLLYAAINLGLCWYFFVFMRWRGILRGMGAPGYMSYWLGACVFSLELARAVDPSGDLVRVALLCFQLDFAAIMTCAGAYKGLAGYTRGQGMELGMVNPWWGYWSDFFRSLPPGHLLFRPLNPLAVLVQVTAGVMMMVPATRPWGALLIMVGFVGITTQIRLGVLCEMVILCGVLFWGPGTLLDRWIAEHAGPFLTIPHEVLAVPAWAPLLLAAFWWTYILLLPFAKAGQYYNFLARKRLPAPLQVLLERWTNTWGIIIWRVFSVDVINFFARVYVQDPTSGAESEYTTLGRPWPRNGGRYFHVGEFVCLASLFTTMKYYPSQPEIFHQRLVTYARTLPCPVGGRVRFELFSVRKLDDGYDYVPAADYLVDPEAREVEEILRDPTFDPRVGHQVSPVHEGAGPGTYAPPAGS